MKNCPACHDPVEVSDRFCETCGFLLIKDLSAAATFQSLTEPISPNCQKCGSTNLEADGFCNQCGFRNPIHRDRFEQILQPSFAAISDRGIRHSQNEDCFAVAQLADGRSIIVVCDGVSSSMNPGMASQSASQSACESIQESLKTNLDPEAALVQGIHQAQIAVAKLASISKGEPPSTTIVAAIVSACNADSSNSDLSNSDPSNSRISSAQATIAWLGDSRAYWLGSTPETSRQLTQDHSWCEDVVAAGKMSREEAERSPQAHAITRWLGFDSEDIVPSVVTIDLAGPGRLVLCSDGLWNYASGVPEFYQALHNPPGTEATVIVRQGVEFALRCGGQDNITLALLELQSKVPETS
jgi:serine/threonine protein phosphatase PrpC